MELDNVTKGETARRNTKLQLRPLCLVFVVMLQLLTDLTKEKRRGSGRGAFGVTPYHPYRWM